jgi:hypothetical protein
MANRLWIAVTIAILSLSQSFAATEPDPTPAEQVLLPLYFVQPLVSRDGLSWKTEVWAYNPTDRFVPADNIDWGCQNLFCPPILGVAAHSAAKLRLSEQGNGAAILNVADSPGAVGLSLRLIEETHPWLEIELPILRESDFDQRTIQLLNVPVRAGSRLTLRIYDPRARGGAIRVSFYAMESAELIAMFDTQFGFGAVDYPTRPAEPAWTEIGDLTSLVPELAGYDRIRITIEPLRPMEIWAFVSVTDNATGFISLVTPK